MSGALPAGAAFAEARPEAQAPPPCAALAPLLFFPIEEGKHFLLLLTLCPGQPESRGWTGQDGEAPAQAAVKGPGPPCLGQPGHLPLGVQAKTCPFWAAMSSSTKALD